MKKRYFCLILAGFSLTMLLSGCFGRRQEESNFAGAGEIPEGSFIIIGDGNGIIGGLQGGDQDVEVEEDPNQGDNRIELPDGTRVPETNVQTLEDGTVVAYIGDPFAHRCFFTDGTYAYTQYTKEDGMPCLYSEATEYSLKWYLQNGSLWKEEYYQRNSGGEFYLLSGKELEYTQLEIGTADSPWYHSATVETWYENGSYRTCRAEYDGMHGSDKPIKCYYYDGSYSEHEYTMDGKPKKDTYYNANGVKTQQEFYENGQRVTTYLFREDGSQQYVTNYAGDQITTETYYSGDGSYRNVTYYKNGYRDYAIVYYKDGRISTSHYDSQGCTIKEVYNNADGSLDWYVEYENYSNGYVKKATYYDGNGNVTRVEEYDQNGNLIN